jgi:predicted GNAT superfamily acetyltransferase
VSINIRYVDEITELAGMEALQRLVWSGNETEVVPVHLLAAVVHNGGLAIGAFDTNKQPGGEEMVGFVFGFPGLYHTPDGPRLKHCSHLLAVHPDYRDQGIGFMLKRAQWQMVRNQGIDRITWTYDPLQSRNAYLNIVKLGAVCNTYLRNVYGEMRDGINAGMISDRFQVDWWVNSARVNRRLSRRARPPLDLAHYHAAGAQIANPSQMEQSGFPRPGETLDLDLLHPAERILLVEIPANYGAIQAHDPEAASAWRLHTRQVLEDLFAQGFLVTDFVHLPGAHARSFYVLSHGESTF